MSLIHRRCTARVASPDRFRKTNSIHHLCANAIDSGDHMRSLRGRSRADAWRLNARLPEPPSAREAPASLTKALHLAWLPLGLAIRRKFNAMQDLTPVAS